MYLVPTASPDELEAIQYIPSSLNRAAHTSSDSFFCVVAEKRAISIYSHPETAVSALVAPKRLHCRSSRKPSQNLSKSYESFWQLRDSPNVSLLPSPARDPCSSSLIASPAIIRTWKHNAPLRYVKHIPIE